MQHCYSIYTAYQQWSYTGKAILCVHVYAACMQHSDTITAAFKTMLQLTIVLHMNPALMQHYCSMAEALFLCSFLQG